MFVNRDLAVYVATISLAADSDLCPVRSREVEILRLVESSRCSKNEAWNSTKERSSSVSSETGVGQKLTETYTH